MGAEVLASFFGSQFFYIQGEDTFEYFKNKTDTRFSLLKVVKEVTQVLQNGIHLIGL